MKNSNIEWTTHTFNPWIGCTKVSSGCAHCYAETLNKRMGWTQWGDAGERFRTSEHNWNESSRWNRESAKTGQRARVFCASLADWLDDRAPIEWVADLLALVQATPHLDWLLLTKRPQNWRERVEAAALCEHEERNEKYGRNFGGWAQSWLNGIAPANVWFGVSAEDQTRWDERMKLANEIPAEVRFVSGEPLLGPIVMGAHRPDWLIVGGESGPGSREMKPEWVRALRDECAATGVRFFFKQWGGVKKKEAGRLLDGETFDQLPACAEESNKQI